MHSDAQRGTSLVELLFVLLATGWVLVAVTNFVFGSRTSLIRQENARDLVTMNIRMSTNTRASLAPSSLIIADYSGSPDLSNIYARINAGIAAGPSRPKIAHSALPVAAEGKPELGGTAPANAFWGNDLCFLAVIGPVTFTSIVSPTGVPITTPYVGYVPVIAPAANAHVAVSYNIDRIQFVDVYITQDPGLRVRGMPGALRLTEWRSRPYVTYQSLSGYDPAQLPTICTILLERGYDYAVDTSRLDTASLTASPNLTFYKIKNAAPYLDNTVAAPAVLPTHSWSFLEDYNLAHSFNPLPLKPLGRVSMYGASNTWGAGNSAYSVAYNNVNPTVNPTTKVRRLFGSGPNDLVVPQYAQMDRGTVGFPAGFEVGLYGRASSRQLYIRRVLMASSGGNPRGNARDFPAQEYMDYMTVNSPY